MRLYYIWQNTIPKKRWKLLGPSPSGNFGTFANCNRLALKCAAWLAIGRSRQSNPPTIGCKTRDLWKAGLKTIQKSLISMIAPNHSVQWWWCPRKSLKVCVGSKSWAKVILSTVKLWTILNYAIMKAFSLLILITLLALWNRICCDYALFRSLFMSKDHRWPLHLKFGEIIEKSSMSMVNLRKNIQWWWSSSSKTIENPLQALVSRKKIITIPSSWKNYHCRSLISYLGKRDW